MILCVYVKSYTIRYKRSKAREYRTVCSCKNIPTLNQEKKKIQILQASTVHTLITYPRDMKKDQVSVNSLNMYLQLRIFYRTGLGVERTQKGTAINPKQ